PLQHDDPKVNRRPLRSCTDAWTSLEKERRPMTQETLAEPQSAQKQLTQDAAAAPRIPRRPQERTMHGDTAVIDHGWLRTLDPAAIAAHLDADTPHTAHRTAHPAQPPSAHARDPPAPQPPTEVLLPVRNGAWWYLDRPPFLAGHGMAHSLSRVPDSADL